MITGCGLGAHAPASTSGAGSAAGSIATSPAERALAAKACGLITRAEASSALKQRITRQVVGRSTFGAGVACAFYAPDVPPSADPNLAQPDSVRITVATGPDAVRTFDDYRAKVHPEPIPGLGDRAFYDGSASVSVLKGSTYVRIMVGVANNLTPEKILAFEAVPRM